MTPYDIAQGYIGTTEAPGAADNPEILEMYATIGQDWIEHDEVAWCAAFVGHCLEKAGLRSTRKLTARSYLEWGIPIEMADAQPGDIVVFRRGNSAWQGHVGFFVAQSGAWIEVLGGNQGDAVNVKRYLPGWRSTRSRHSWRRLKTDEIWSAAFWILSGLGNVQAWCFRFLGQ